MALTSQYERRPAASGLPEVGFTKRTLSCWSDDVLAMYVFSAATGHNVLSLPKAGNCISGGRGFLRDWFLKMNPGEVGSTALEGVRVTPFLDVAASSLTLLPDARAVRNRVFIRMLTGDAVLRLNSSVENTSSTLSTDHWGILRFWEDSQETGVLPGVRMLLLRSQS